MHAEATGLRQQPSTFKMNNLVSLPPGIKSEDIPIPSRESSREFSLPFRPSPAKYLKYPGLDMPDIIITEQN
ncbi:uncharacterized protein CLUP02_16675 [Colletotrichum lupini]|uniref:Uncharacterized protein n=1 Tax=Colletotrichum lupini TaxID=145971 RepID=A0A9Q8T8C3_9PEZI|nr:uncharacterized protein CLUP02_16675 [Colletotrichum lupini]UQC91141.1 hypothetical protein CLUP02_16675 [Colletotrichum lupini]